MTVIGIDLGTTNSLVSYWGAEGPIIIPNAFGEDLTPSIVSVDEDNTILIGKIAKERLISHPMETAAIFKRFMGTEKKYQLKGFAFTPVDLSSFIIKSLKSDAKAFLKEEITQAVISVPAYFNDIQRKATKQAAELAGLKVERLISEPTAAAISYGIYEEDAESKYLVFDLGGGTFDVSILELFDGIIEVKSIAGDNYLGGEDITNVLVTHFMNTHELDLEKLDRQIQSFIYKQAELCKLAFSAGDVMQMSITMDDHTYETTITAEEFETLVTPLLLRLRYPIERTLRDASFTASDLDAIILIGGATKMPLIRAVVAKMIGRIPFLNVNADKSVALGVAVQAALKERNEALDEVILTDVCPFTLGTNIMKELRNGEQEAGHFLPIIERNTPIPVSRVERLFTIQDNQKIIRIDVYQGESRRVENNVELGVLEVPVPKAPAGEQSIDLRYTYDINGMLEVEVTIVSTDEKKRLVIEQNDGSLSSEEIDARFLALENIKIHPRDQAENRYLLAQAERLYEELLGDRREEIAFYIIAFESVLATQNEREIARAALRLKEQMAYFEGKL